MMRTPLTCVSAYYPVKNKHSNKYLEWFKNTLSIQCPYVFFTPKDTVHIIKSFRKDLPTYYIQCEIEDFYTYKYKDKMLTHAGDCPSVELNLIWNEKLFMVQKASEINPFNSEWFKWIDAGTCVFRDFPPPSIPFPNPSALISMPTDKFIFSSSLEYYALAVILKQYTHHISGTSYLLHKSYIAKFVEIYKQYMERLIDKSNIWTDQVILTHIYKDYPEFFYKACDGYGEITTMLYR